jgi:hypothetical protein
MPVVRAGTSERQRVVREGEAIVKAASILLLVATSLASVATGSGARAARPETPAEGFGLSIGRSPGWHVRVRRGTIEASTNRLPAPGRWVAKRLSSSLRGGAIGFLLFEDEPAPGVPFSGRIYRRGRPRPFAARDFRGPPLGGSNPGNHSFARRNFALSGRYFDLFVESAAAKPSRATLESLNRVIASLHVRRGEYYRGRAAAAAFAPAAGWFVRRTQPLPLAPETSTITVASTVRDRDPLNAFPPDKTLVDLPRDGAVIVLDLVASNRDPPVGEKTRPLRVGDCSSFEGVPSKYAVCPLSGFRSRRYAISGWIVYGRASPTGAMRRHAAQELARLQLPDWPLWE